ncbi:MAG: hypothetical protein JWN83_2899 [Chitinophagaceae bacterium]|nr:hypothetical protein [Chitinophagaceae bacterium]
MEIILWGLGSIILGLVLALLPSKYTGRSPQTLNEYIIYVKGWIIFVIILCLIVAVIIRIKYWRIKYDIRKDYQKEGIFQIKRIINFGTFKILVLNNGHYLMLKSNSDKFYDIKSGQIIKVIKSATNKLLKYKILK